MTPAEQKAHDEIHGLKAVRAGLNDLWHMAGGAPEVRKIVENTRRELDGIGLELGQELLHRCDSCEFRKRVQDPMM